MTAQASVSALTGAMCFDTEGVIALLLHTVLLTHYEFLQVIHKIWPLLMLFVSQIGLISRVTLLSIDCHEK